MGHERSVRVVPVSLITDAVLTVFYAPREIEFTEVLEFDIDRRQSFRKVDTEHSGGSKVFCSDVYAASLNYVTPSSLTEWFKGLGWGTVCSAILVYDYEGMSWGLVAVHNGEFVEQSFQRD